MTSTNDVAHRFSIVLLTYNRPESVVKAVNSLADVVAAGAELIVIDNNSTVPAQVSLKDVEVPTTVVRLDTNRGTGGRNVGINRATRDFVVTLDDDVYGFSLDDCRKLSHLFDKNPTVGAACFRVLDEKTRDQINWCHHRRIEDWGDKTFITDEISEGAVSFRRSAVKEKDLYPEDFFISHEGPAAAIRIMNAGFCVLYLPEIFVNHATEETARTSWRRYFYDTRNVIWLSLQFYPFLHGLRVTFMTVAAIFVYSIRDGYFIYWLRGLAQGLKGSARAFKQREKPSSNTKIKLKEIRRFKPGFFYMLKKRLGQKSIRI